VHSSRPPEKPRFVGRPSHWVGWLHHTGGSLDATFGASGLATPDFRVADVAVSPDGKIVGAGSDVVIIGPDPEDPEGSIGREVVAVGRFNADGSPDATFGEGGKVLTELHEVNSRALAVLIQTDGKIVAAGLTNLGDFPTDTFAVARYLGAPSPQHIIQQLLDDVNELVAAGALNQGQGDALAAILRQAANRLEEGNAQAAANEIRAFINQVNALVRAGTLSSSQGRPLIDHAEAILSQIGQ
jgi:hypothetical protein